MVTVISNFLSLRKLRKEGGWQILPQVIQEDGDQNTSTSGFQGTEVASQNFFRSKDQKYTG